MDKHRDPPCPGQGSSGEPLPWLGPPPRGGARHQGCVAAGNPAPRSAHRPAASPALPAPPPGTLRPGRVRGVPPQGHCAAAGSAPGAAGPPQNYTSRRARPRGAGDGDGACAGLRGRSAVPHPRGREAGAPEPSNQRGARGAEDGVAGRGAAGADSAGSAASARGRREEGGDHARGDTALGAGGGWSSGGSAPRE